MIEVFDTAAARRALGRRKLPCPDCGQPLRPWGRARQRTIRELGGALVTVRPDRGRCTGCGVTHVVLGAALLPRRAHTATLIGQALVAAACGDGHRRIAGQLALPHGTVRGWIRRARRSASQLRIAGIQAVVAFGPDALREDGVRYAAVLRAAGVPVRFTGYVGVPHGFVSFSGLSGAAYQAMSEVCAGQREALGPLT